jgi:molybdopterin synthase sulfur carrier subunit
MISVTVRYFAAARAAAGSDDENLTVPVGSTVDHLIDAVRSRHGDAMANVLPRCSFLLDEVAVTGHRPPLRSGATLDILPPFAGG